MAGGSHSHAKGTKCSCDAIVFGFTIDCENTQAMTDALARLQSGGCASNCHTESCEKDWLMVLSHHDHCPMDSLPIAVENGFHDYDRVCNTCDIVRKEIPNAPTCPLVDCVDNGGNEAYERLLTKNCNLKFQCTENNCKDDYLTLKMVHDTCGHDVLSQAAEEGLHALDEPCEAFQCNLPTEVIATTLECFENELEDARNAYDDMYGAGGGSTNSSPSGSPNQSPSGSFDFGSGAVSLATGSIVAMTMVVAALL
jgi:hypothetical protein